MLKCPLKGLMVHILYRKEFCEAEIFNMFCSKFSWVSGIGYWRLSLDFPHSRPILYKLSQLFSWNRRDCYHYHSLFLSLKNHVAGVVDVICVYIYIHLHMFVYIYVRKEFELAFCVLTSELEWDTFQINKNNFTSQQSLSYCIVGS